jgi:hypothetical protein
MLIETQKIGRGESRKLHRNNDSFEEGGEGKLKLEDTHMLVQN